MRCPYTRKIRTSQGEITIRGLKHGELRYLEARGVDLSSSATFDNPEAVEEVLGVVLEEEARGLLDDLYEAEVLKLLENVLKLTFPSREDQERMTLAAALWVNKTLWDCASCEREGKQRERHCPRVVEDPPFPLFKVRGREIFHCPMPELSPYLSRLQEYVFFEQGILPEGGGLNDQWEYDLQVLLLISSVVAEETKQGGKGL